jgi:hypothetical protein
MMNDTTNMMGGMGMGWGMTLGSVLVLTPCCSVIEC